MFRSGSDQWFGICRPPDAGSALSNGDWILVMTHQLPPKDKRHVPGRVEIRKRHGLKTRLSPRSTVDGFPKLTTSATSQHDRIAVGDVSGNVYELICNADRHITVGATRRANQLAGTGSMVSDIVATPDGEWVAAINLRGGDSTDGISGGGVWVLEQATLKPKHHVVGLDAVGALAVRHDGSIIVGTNSGALLVFDRTLSKRISQVDGFDSVTHIVLPVASDGSVTRVSGQMRRATLLAIQTGLTRCTPRAKPAHRSRWRARGGLTTTSSAPQTRQHRTSRPRWIWRTG